MKDLVLPSGKNSTTDARPSLDVHSNKAPYSEGAQEIELTEALWTLCSVIVDQIPFSSFQTNTRPSYEQDAKITPNLGCAQLTCHTGPSCPCKVSTNLC